ncbi:TetR/AcrR family transcriptional regulator [Gordonia sp. PDNC005]|uniref:TetR/AcrR family transcriptional regulator n=1 Tax=unclassified Gordonia (in: high G+C Gram-positive bacteria) TaxID=2657482 RepID=UPI001965E007|nr:TetR/AcrR family transcriptional regulator [Gordonia sp. PDNC005]QRY62687.1 TetR/AcrR family transcriptional regulator [Gordonia sp. PDNC005]
MTSEWTGARRSAARDRILQVAAEQFAEHGGDVSMSDLAAAAGCSRATLYRHFDSRTALQLAYIAQVAGEISSTIEARLAGIDDGPERVTEGVLIALAEVRADPALTAWFTSAGAGLTSELALSSDSVGAITTAFTRDATAAGWIVRVIVSLLIVPSSADDERTMIERFVTPALRSPTPLND